jgi:iron complex outermembrane receptor protein
MARLQGEELMSFSRSLRRTDLALRVSGIALAGALAVAASPAFAQDAGSPAPDDQAANDIVVSGFRASLQSATAKKKNVDQVVESVTAEDIGKLPDASIAEGTVDLRPGPEPDRRAVRHLPAEPSGAGDRLSALWPPVPGRGVVQVLT